MKLFLKQEKDISETEVRIKYAQMNRRIQGLINFIQREQKHITGYIDGRIYRILVSDIFYIERVDKNTFIYTEKDIFQSELNLQQLFELIESEYFMYINRICILNVSVLDSVKVILNSKMEATLINGEKLLVSRRYLANIKEIFKLNEGKKV